MSGWFFKTDQPQFFSTSFLMIASRLCDYYILPISNNKFPSNYTIGPAIFGLAEKRFSRWICSKLADLKGLKSFPFGLKLA